MNGITNGRVARASEVLWSSETGDENATGWPTIRRKSIGGAVELRALRGAVTRRDPSRVARASEVLWSSE